MASFTTYRNEKGLTNRALAADIGVNHELFQKYMLGYISPSWKTMEKLEAYHQEHIGAMT